jgi:hypothetical protein
MHLNTVRSVLCILNTVIAEQLEEGCSDGDGSPAFLGRGFLCVRPPTEAASDHPLFDLTNCR